MLSLRPQVSDFGGRIAQQYHEIDAMRGRVVELLTFAVLSTPCHAPRHMALTSMLDLPSFRYSIYALRTRVRTRMYENTGGVKEECVADMAYTGGGIL